MRGVDLSLFQFDYDLTWAGLFLNADGTVYGRYGSRTGGKKGAEALISVAGLRKALGRALDHHAAYPANREAFRGKRAPGPKWRTPEQMPALDGKFDRPGDASCIHCHHAYSGWRRSLALEKSALPDSLIWTYPLPENVGVRIDVDEGNAVAAILPGSIAERAGVRAGDVLVSVDGQPILSPADVQWALHATGRLRLPVEVRREGAVRSLALDLEGPWRRGDLSWRESMWDARPGLWLVELTAEERAKAGLAAGVLGLRVKWVLPEGPAKGAGFQDGDLLVEFDGKSEPMDESVLVAKVRQGWPPGSKIPVVVVRGGRRISLPLPVE